MTIGIDVMILAAFGCLLVVMSYMLTARLSEAEATASVTSTAATALLMVVAYVIMAGILDVIAGAYW